MERWRRLVATVFLVALLSCAPLARAVAQGVSTAPAAAPLTNAELDALLEAKDWGRLGSGLLPPPRDAASFKRYLDWLQAKISGGAGFLVTLIYMRELWAIGDSMKLDDPERDLRMTAGIMALYGYELIVLDGAKCEDRSAPSNRLTQLFTLNSATFGFLKSRAAELKERVVTLALALEKKTAPLRRDDDLLCRDGLEQMRAGLERGTQQEVPTAPGQIGKTVAVAPPADWVPKFVAPETYVPMQSEARATMRETLLKLIQ